MWIYFTSQTKSEDAAMTGHHLPMGTAYKQGDSTKYWFSWIYENIDEKLL